VSTASSVLPVPIRPTDEDVRIARESAPKLNRLKHACGAVNVTVGRGTEAEKMQLPQPVLEMLSVILDELADGHAVTVAPLDREITTQAAADLLNVSRPYLVKQLEAGQIPFRKVGTHRRVRLADVLRYRARLEAEAERAYSELVELSQELGLYE
jgi:excisionase family DNA binding protein